MNSEQITVFFTGALEPAHTGCWYRAPDWYNFELELALRSHRQT